MCRWLGYGTQRSSDAAQQLLHRREFSFTTGDDVYIRYLSYEDAAAFKKVSLGPVPPSSAVQHLSDTAGC